MDFISLAKKRCSVRAFKNDKVESEKVDLILQAGRLAPTACNNQPQRILVLESQEDLVKFKKCTSCHFNAPLAFVVGYDDRECWIRDIDKKSSGDIDATIVATHMILQAAELGIGTTLVMVFDPQEINTQFSLDQHFHPTILIPAGYPTDDYKPSKLHDSRKQLTETVTKKK